MGHTSNVWEIKNFGKNKFLAKTLIKFSRLSIFITVLLVYKIGPVVFKVDNDDKFYVDDFLKPLFFGIIGSQNG